MSNKTNKLNLGLQPISNRFIKEKTSQEFLHPIDIIQNDETGLVQIKHPAPYNEMHSKYKWLKETEPEHHFKSVSETILSLNGINANSKIIALSYRDMPIVKHLKRMGFKKIDSITYDKQDYNPSFIGVAKLQHKLSQADFIDEISREYGSYDLILVNRIAHHFHNLDDFFHLISSLMNKDAYVVLEVPDCERGFASRDYNIIFEEHISYFTEITLKNIISLYRFDLVDFQVFPYPLEDALIAIIKQSNRTNIILRLNSIRKEKDLFKIFCQDFPSVKSSISSFFKYKSAKGSIVLFGAGHHGITFVNFMCISKYIDCFIDDLREKHNYLCPGSLLPVRGSDYFLNKKISMCAVSVSQENESKVINAIKAKCGSAFEIFSIFPESEYALPVYCVK